MLMVKGGRRIHITFLVILTIYIEVDGHMIAQNDTLGETQIVCKGKTFWSKQIASLGQNMSLTLATHATFVSLGFDLFRLSG